VSLRTDEFVQTDVGIVTILADCELPAVLRAFGRMADAEPDATDGGTRYWLADVECRPLRRRLSVVITVVGESGNSDVSAATTSLIENYRPSLVCLSGIAAGVAGQVRLGDAIIGFEILGYEKEKLLPGDERDRRPSHKEPWYATRADTVLFLSHLPEDTLTGRIDGQLRALPRRALPPRRLIPKPVRVVHKIIASGEKLFGDGSLRTLAETFHDKRIVAGEMEAFGFAVAAERKHCPWLVCRGISDYGDPRSKDGRYKDRFHNYASVVAAEVTHLFLEKDYSGPPPPLSVEAVQEAIATVPDLHVRTVLVTIHDKTGFEPLIRYFIEQHINIVATPNTAAYLRSLGCEPQLTFDFSHCRQISFTRGTLHPYILAATAADPTNADQLAELRAADIAKIELVVVNTKEPQFDDSLSHSELLHRLGDVQIGGASLLRWVVKHWRSCAAVVSPDDYVAVLRSMREHDNVVPLPMRARLLNRALQYVSYKDAETARLLNALWTEPIISHK
jgi:nucleoside phosphorylase